MKQTLKFQVTVEKSAKEWIVSEVFDSYGAAQKWRHEQEAKLLMCNSTRYNVRSNLIFIRETVAK